MALRRFRRLIPVTALIVLASALVLAQQSDAARSRWSD